MGARFVRSRALLAIVILGAIALAAYYAVRVPFFEQPDENTHADYAFALASSHRLLRGFEGVPSTDVHPSLRYLETVASFKRVRYDRDGRVDRSYGSRAFFARADAHAPRVPPDFSSRPTPRIPYIMLDYPFGYYGVVAAIIAVTHALAGNAPVLEMFAARGFSVVLLGITLTLGYAILRAMRRSREEAVALTAVIGFFPLVTWTFAYVQPDDLAIALLYGLLFTMLAIRRGWGGRRSWIAASFLLGALALVKPHIFGIGVLVMSAFVAWRVRRAPDPFSRALGTLAFAIPSVAAIALDRIVRAHPQSAEPRDYDGLAGSLVRDLAAEPTRVASEMLGTVATLGSRMFGGRAFEQYWHEFAWTGGDFFERHALLGKAIDAAILYATVAIATLFVYRQARVAIRLTRVARTRGTRTCVRVLGSDVVLNAYVFLVVVVAAAGAYTRGAVPMAGRYFEAGILPTCVLAVVYIPRLARGPFRRLAARTMLFALLAYSFIGSAFGIATIDSRFYRPTDDVARFERAVSIDVPSVRSVRGRTTVTLTGYAWDSHRTSKVDAIELSLNGVRQKIIYPLPCFAVANAFNDDGLRNSGFRGTFAFPTGASQVVTLRVREGGRWFDTATTAVVLRSPSDAIALGDPSPTQPHCPSMATGRSE